MANLPSIHEAVRYGNVNLVEEILKGDPRRANEWDENFNTPLLVVYDHVDSRNPFQANDRLPIINLLIENNADINAQTGNMGETLLHIAVKKQQIEGVKLLLIKKADPNIVDYKNQRALINTLELTNKKYILTKLLLQHGAKVNDNHVFFNVTDLQFWRILLETGTKVFDVLVGMTYACYNKNKDLLNFLLNHGANLHISSEFTPKVLLYVAVKSFGINLKKTKDNSTAFFHQVLHERGININEFQLNDENTRLHEAIKKKKYRLVKFLIRIGVNINAKNIYRDTPLHVLLNQSHDYNSNYYEVLTLLLEKGALINDRNYSGYTPFLLAMENGCIRSINIILAYLTGIKESTLKNDIKKIHVKKHFPRDIMYQDTSFELYLAICLSYDEIVDALINNSINKQDPLYLSIALKWKRYKITKMLIESDFQNISRDFIFIGRPDGNNVKLISLVWTLLGYSVLQSTVRYILWREALMLRRNLMYCDKLAQMCILFFAIEQDLEKLSPKYNPLEELSTKFDALKILNVLKKKKACRNKSSYDILTMKLDYLVKFLNNAKNFKACSNLSKEIKGKRICELECYEVLLLEKINLAVEKRVLLNSAMHILQEILEKEINLNIPKEITYKLLSYMNVRDLRKMAISKQCKNQ